MTNTSLILLMSLVAGVAHAQSAGGGVTMSTDPAKAAAVEKHAQELQTQQSKQATSKPAASHAATKKTTSKAAVSHNHTSKHSTKPKS